MVEDNECLNIEFTQHILERYVERAVGKSGNEIKQFLVQNEEQVKNQILKLYQYSDLLWYGKNKSHDYTYFRINKNGWVIVVDKNKTKLVTLYKIDLGLGEEFNKEYIARMIDFVNEKKCDIEKSKTEYNELISNSKNTIEDLKKQNNLLQAQINNNMATIKLLEDEDKIAIDRISIKEQELKSKIEYFVGTKLF